MNLKIIVTGSVVWSCIVGIAIVSGEEAGVRRVKLPLKGSSVSRVSQADLPSSFSASASSVNSRNLQASQSVTRSSVGGEARFSPKKTTGTVPSSIAQRGLNRSKGQTSQGLSPIRAGQKEPGLNAPAAPSAIPGKASDSGKFGTAISPKAPSSSRETPSSRVTGRRAE
jgi:hypothetical protein